VLVAAKSNPQISQLQEQLSVLNNAYKAALTKVNSLKQNPPTQSGLLPLFPAHKATKIGGKSSILDRHSVRGLLGIVVGALLGVVLAFLLDALNKTLRTAARTQEMLGYQVLAEIPATNPSRSRLRRRRDQPPPPVFATFSEPGSAVAEAYRMLRTAVLLEPIVGPALTIGLERPSADLASPDADRDGAGPSARTPGSPGAPDRRSRQVILVVSPGVEPTRALVVTNLAAAFAEAGESALIVTTADLRDRDRLDDTLVVAPVGGELSETTVAASTRPTEAPGVRSLALSSVIGGPGLLATRAPAVLAAAREISDAVIIDAPLLAVHDAEALVPAVDVVVVVIESWWTRVDQATTSGVFLRRIAAPVLGAVLTEIRLGKKDLRRVVEPPRRRTDAEDEERLVGTSPMGRLRRKRGRDARWLEA
jgi:Mrp family chromosome partitioning ATPase